MDAPSSNVQALGHNLLVFVCRMNMKVCAISKLLKLNACDAQI